MIGMSLRCPITNITGTVDADHRPAVRLDGLRINDHWLEVENLRGA